MGSQYVDANGLRIHYLEEGEGEPVLMIHGFPTSSHLYRNVLPTIAKTHRAIAPDLPGYGLSDKPLDRRYNFSFFGETLNAFCDAVGIENMTLVVHDLGGPVGLHWAVRNPARIRRLVILNTLTYPQTSWAVKAFLISLRLPFVRDYVVSPKGIVGAMRLGVVHKGRLNREVLTPYTAPFETGAAQKALIKAGSGLSVKGLGEIAAKLPSMGVPVRLIYGERDRILPDIAKTMRRLKSDLPGATLTSLPDAGHFLQEDAPEQVAAMISDFINVA
ncbi:MAG: alpha/beta fold hydrolase [Myxococcota bacterium]